MGFRFPKDLFNAIAVPEDFFVNVHYPREGLLSPLASTLAYISNRLVSASREELKGLFDATVDLIPLGVGAYAAERDHPLQSTDAASLRAVAAFVEDNLTKPALSAAYAAKELQLSESYVHRMFASSGTTFSAHVTAKRLDHVRADLVSPNGRRTLISAIAYRWGFNDLSTFNRSFKKRFGCTPKALRE
jgi:AraC-like DNA-binding protein